LDDGNQITFLYSSNENEHEHEYENERLIPPSPLGWRVAITEESNENDEIYLEGIVCDVIRHEKPQIFEVALGTCILHLASISLCTIFICSYIT